MESIDQVSINDLSKRDLLLIIKALEYTGQNANIEEFLNLKNNIVKELCFLTETTENEFLEYLENNS
ncbi:hypothetical protein H9L25_02505 [Terrisporobacter mayombei]|uniref:hypothetical protein n=1 Tax=Terrisporobacter sp. TaxID=1965305 RepID=UPI001651739A|nr:hypothetical protein [Terrisporobacter sp.]MBC6695653.1 hypothetical protein [Terrisporobacter mayombei]